MKPVEKKLWLSLVILALLSPIGVIMPKLFKAGDAWGEWDSETIVKMIGYVPGEMKRLAGLWHAPIPDYSFGIGETSLTIQIVSYVGSAVIGILLTYMLIWFFSKLLLKKK
jgi:hypothetical protein